MNLSFRFAALMALLCTLAACTTTQNTVTVPTEVFIEPERPIPYPVEEPLNFEEAVQKGTRTYSGEPGEKYWTNWTDYVLNAELSPADTMLYGNASITYTNNSPDTLRLLVFELTQNLHKEGVPRKEFAEITGGVNIERIAVEGTELNRVNRFQPGFAVQGTNLIVIPDEPLFPSDSAKIAIDWNFKIPQAGASGRMGYSRDNLFYLAYWYPHASTYDDLDGWFVDDFTGNAEFYHDFGNYEINITAPEEWIIMSSGKFLNPREVLEPEIADRYQAAGSSDSVTTVISKDDFGNATLPGNEGKLTWKFKAEKVRDVAFSATKESQWDATRSPVGDLDNDDTTDYSRINAFWRSSAPLWVDGADYTQHAIRFLSDYTGISYPWPHMTSVEGAGIIGGGMEFPMMTIIGGYNGRPTEALYDVIAHELAHMWIPMIVSNNERRRAWMDEGSTTFHEANARWDKFPGSFDRLGEFSNYLGIAGSPLEGEIMRWSDYHYPGPAYGVASYPKPGTILIALQGVLGEETFTKAWQTYMSRWAYKHPTPYDMFNTFEDISGKELDWFWRAWYFETWTLDQAVKDLIETENDATVIIEDQGKVPMPVLLKITLEDGTEISERIGVEDWLRGLRETTLSVETSSPVSKVEIDPDHYFPDTNRANNTWNK